MAGEVRLWLCGGFALLGGRRGGLLGGGACCWHEWGVEVCLAESHAAGRRRYTLGGRGGHVVVVTVGTTGVRKCSCLSLRLLLTMEVSSRSLKVALLLDSFVLGILTY